MKVPFFRVDLGDEEIRAAAEVLRSGWLTTGPHVRALRSRSSPPPSARATRSPSTPAPPRCTWPSRRSGLRAGRGGAGAHYDLRRHRRGGPLPGRDAGAGRLRPGHPQVDLADAERKLADLRAGRLARDGRRDAERGRDHSRACRRPDARPRRRRRLCRGRTGSGSVEDAAHALPAAWRSAADAPWQRCGEGTSRRRLLLVLRQQDDHHRRGGHGGHRGRRAGRAHAVDVAARPVAGRLGALLGRAAAGTTGSSRRASNTT